VAKNVSEVITALENIRSDLAYTHSWVVNMSFGTSVYDPDLENICNDLKNNYEVILVAAVDDQHFGTNIIYYPSGFESVIGVGASNRADNALISDSNWGDDVELVATGESIFTLRHDSEDWDTRTGTSFAAPFVSSLCALIYSTENGFYMTPDQVRERLRNTADYIYDNNHNKTFYRINAYRAVNSVVTGIEDVIAIDSSGTTILTPGNSYTYNARFYDYPPTGNYIVGDWTWSLEAQLTNGSEIWDSGNTSGSTYTSWTCTVPYFDPNRNWIRDDNGRVLAYIKVSASDNDGIGHTDFYYVGVNNPPPLSVTINGPSYLNTGEEGTFTATPSGGSGTYTNYKWWKRWDSGYIYSLASKGGGLITPNRPPSGEWIYLPGYEGQQTIQESDVQDFSLKCEVTDSDNNTATDIHSVTVGSASFAVSTNEQALSIKELPKKVVLSKNYPNPFNPTTTIRFGLPEKSKVTLMIFSTTGERVSILVNENLPEGYYQVQWDGTNDSGTPVASGLYIYELKTGEKRIVRKMLLVR